MREACSSWFYAIAWFVILSSGVTLAVSDINAAYDLYLYNLHSSIWQPASVVALHKHTLWLIVLLAALHATPQKCVLPHACTVANCIYHQHTPA